MHNNKSTLPGLIICLEGMSVLLARALVLSYHCPTLYVSMFYMIGDTERIFLPLALTGILHMLQISPYKLYSGVNTWSV